MHRLLKLLLTVVSFAMSQNCHAQKADTTLVRSLNRKATDFFSTYPDSLLIYRDSSFRLAVAINDQVGIAGSYTVLGIYHWGKGDYANAIHAYDTSNQILNRIPNRADKKANNLLNLGMAYSKLGDYPKAIRYLLDALRLAETSGPKSTEASIYNSLGVAYKNNNSLSSATDAYTKALDIYTEIKKPESIAGCYVNIGNVFMLKKENEKALEFHQKAFAVFDSLKIYKGIIICYNNIATVYLEMKKAEPALQYSQHALALSREKGFFTSEISAMLGIGMAQTQLKNYKEAERSFLEAIALAKKKNYRSELTKLYKSLSNCYKAMGKSSEALGYYEQYTALNDSIFNQSSLTTISNLQLAYDLEKKEASIQLLQKDNEIKRLSINRIVLGAVVLFLLAGLVVVRQRAKIKKDKLLAQQQTKLHDTERALIQSELKIAQVKEAELTKEIEYKNKSLTTYALSMVQKNEILEEVRESVELILKKPDNQEEHFKKLSKVVDYSFSLEKDWDEFKIYFEDVHNNFFTKLRERFPDLGGADLKLCALIRLNLNMKQSAAILRISPDSVKIARHRLRKKFNLQTEDNLNGFIMSL
jgi:tetratricopeptide (TPR) repeat protein